MVSREILNSHPISTLKKEISKVNIKKYSKLTKPQLVELMMKFKERFGHIKMAEKKARAPRAAKPKKEDKPGPVQGPRNLKKGFGIKRLPKTFVSNKKYPKVFSMLLSEIDNSGYFSETKYSKSQKDEKGKPFELKPEKNEATPIVNEYIKIVEKSSFGKNLLEQAEKALPLKAFTDNASVETLDRTFNDFLGTSFGEQETFDNIKPKPAEASLKKLGEMFEERSRINVRSKEDKNIIKKHKNLVSYMRSKPSQSEVNKAVDSDKEYQVVKNRLESMYGNYLKKRN